MNYVMNYVIWDWFSWLTYPNKSGRSYQNIFFKLVNLCEIIHLFLLCWSCLNAKISLGVIKISYWCLILEFVSRIEAPFPFWIAVLIRWIKKISAFGSFVILIRFWSNIFDNLWGKTAKGFENFIAME